MFKQEMFQSYPTILHSQQVIGYLPQDTKVTIGRWTFHNKFPTTLSTFFQARLPCCNTEWFSDP